MKAEQLAADIFFQAVQTNKRCQLAVYTKLQVVEEVSILLMHCLFCQGKRCHASQ